MISETQAAGWLDAVEEAVIVVREGSVHRANLGAERLLHAGEAGLAGRPIESLLMPGEALRLDRALRLASTSGHAGPFRLRLRRLTDGREVPVDLRWTGIALEGGEANVLCARDVSHTARAEDLIGYLAQLTGTAESFPDVDALLDTSEPIFQALGWSLVLFDIEGDGARLHRIIAHSPDPERNSWLARFAGRTLPLDRTTGVGRVVKSGEAIFLDDLPRRLTSTRPEYVPLAENFEGRNIDRAAFCPVRVGDALVHVLLVLGPDLSEWDFVAVELFAAQLGSTLRLSELRAELVERERLAALGDINTEFAHRLAGAAEVLEAEAEGLAAALVAEPTGQRLLDMLREEVSRLHRLASDLLSFARPPTARLVPTAVSGAIERAVSVARDDPATSGIDAIIDVDLPGDLPLVNGDAQLLPEALAKILVNALQHAPSGGRVSLSAARDGERGVCLRIHDDGPTIPADTRARIFEPFFTTKAMGTGLGLSVARRIVEDLGGTLDLSAEGPGVTFEIRLPAAGEPVA